MAWEFFTDDAVFHGALARSDPAATVLEEFPHAIARAILTSPPRTKLVSAHRAGTGRKSAGVGEVPASVGIQ